MDVGAHFWIWGEDERVYGPVGARELGEWIAENRAGIGTWVAPALGEAAEELTPPASIPPAAPWKRLEDCAAAPLLLMAKLLLAPLWKRAVAYLLDSVLLSGALGLMLVVAVAARPEWQAAYIDPAVEQLRQGNISSAMAFFLWAVLAGYWTYFHGAYGQTPGKRWLGLRVVTLAGQPIGWSRAAGRAVFALLGGFFYGAGYLIAWWSPRRQTLHDWLTGTVVVEG